MKEGQDWKLSKRIHETHWLYPVLFSALLWCPTVTCLQFTADRVTEFTLHTTKVTWPEARDICSSTGGVLLDCADSYKVTIVEDLFRIAGWISHLSPENYAVWIGFYDLLPPNHLFTWTNSCQAMDPAAHGYTFPPTSSERRCGLSNGTEPNWLVANCSEKHMFVCESQTAINLYCNYTTVEKKFIFSSQSHTNPSGPTTAEYCQSTCLNDPQCWATYLSLITGEKCVSYIKSSPENLSLLSYPTTDVFVKDCIEDKLEVLSNTTGNGGVFPIECYAEFNLTTTTSTTELSITTEVTPLTTETSTSSLSTTTESSISTETTHLTTQMSTSSPTTITEISISTETQTSGLSTQTSPASSSEFSTTSEVSTAPAVVSSTTAEHSVLAVETSTSSTTTNSLGHTSRSYPTTRTEQISSSTLDEPITKPITLPLTTSSELPTQTDCVSTDSSSGQCLVVSADTEKNCLCPCYPWQNNVNLSEKDKDAIVEEILESLTVNKSGLSSTRRRLTSAADERPSAAYVGGAAIALLSLFGVFLLALDLDRFLSFTSDVRLHFRKCSLSK